MKARIDAVGRLEIQPQNTTEAYAVVAWFEKAELGGYDKRVIGCASLTIKKLELNDEDGRAVLAQDTAE